MLGWVKKNKLVVVLVVLFLGYWLWNNSDLKYRGLRNSVSYDYGVTSDSYYGSAEMGMPATLSVESSKMAVGGMMPPVSPSESANRMMVQNGSISLLVKDVSETQGKISEYVKNEGGYVVNSDTTRPTEQPFGNMTVRVPADKLESAFVFLRGLGLKVTSENLSGYDVTDQYEDLETRLSYLQKSLTQIQAIQDRAESYEDILSGTREVISLQSQIDSLKGRQMYLEQTAKLALVNVSMSTDEFALPYAPDSNFRPAVIFKLAVRGLMTTLQNWAGDLIWVGVYSVIWLPLLLIALVIWKKMNKKNKTGKASSGERLIAMEN